MTNPPPAGISDKRVNIIVAIIALVGVLIPVIFNAAMVRTPEHPDLAVQITPPDSGHYVPNKPAESTITVTNKGSAPASNLSLILNTSPMKIVSVTNKFSTTNLTLPQFNNTDLEIGRTKAINSSILKIHVPKLIHGPGSIIQLGTSVSSSDPNAEGHVYAVFDQGSTISGIIYPYPPAFAQLLYQFFNDFYTGPGFYTLFYYAFFSTALFLFLRWLLMKRKRRSKDMKP